MGRPVGPAGRRFPPSVGSLPLWHWGGTCSGGEPWQVPTPRVLGGTATISWYLNGVEQTPVKFCVKAYNPYYGPDLDAILDGGGYWFRRLVANHESGASQFCEPQRYQKAWCAGGFWAEPIWGFPRGYGMMQIDPPQGSGGFALGGDDTYEGIWNWRANLNHWAHVTRAKAGEFIDTGIANYSRANPYSFRQLQQWSQNNSNHSAAPIDSPAVSIEGSCTFTQGAVAGASPINGAYSFADAILMKQLGGANPQYISYLNLSNPPRWNLCRRNSINSNIVLEFCGCQSVTGCAPVSFTPPVSDCATNGN